jgi:hypothetical protein
MRERVCSREWERERGRMRERERGERVCKKEREGRDDERVCKRERECCYIIKRLNMPFRYIVEVKTI